MESCQVSAFRRYNFKVFCAIMVKMDIKKVDRKPKVQTAKLKPSSSTPVSARVPSFGDVLSEKETGRWREKCAKLLQKVDEHAERLRSMMSFESLTEYKETVRAFLEEAIGHAYRVKEERLTDRKGRQKVLSLVKKVDDYLEALTKEFLEKPDGGFSLLRRLDEIRGILVDMYS